MINWLDQIKRNIKKQLKPELDYVFIPLVVLNSGQKLVDLQGQTKRWFLGACVPDLSSRGRQQIGSYFFFFLSAERRLTSYFCLLSFSPRSNFSASSDISHCHISSAFSLQAESSSQGLRYAFTVLQSNCVNG